MIVQTDRRRASRVCLGRRRLLRWRRAREARVSRLARLAAKKPLEGVLTRTGHG